MLRVGLVGAGAIGRAHLATFPHIEGLSLVGVADPLLERARALAAPLGAEAHADERALLGRVEAVWLCTPPEAHPEQALAFAAAGAHLFCEKPIALTLAAADRMIVAARRAGVHLMIGQVVRFYPETIALKRLIEAGELGEPVGAFGRRHLLNPPAEWTDWRRDSARSGGFVLDSVIHEVDTVRHLAGEITSVYGRLRFGDPGHPAIETDLRAILGLANGGSAIVEASCLAPLPEWAWGVSGSRATALSPQRGLVRIARPSEAVREIRVEPVADTQRGCDGAMLAENRAFVDAIAADRAPPVPGEEGRRSLAVILAARRSAREGRLVDV